MTTASGSANRDSARPTAGIAEFFYSIKKEGPPGGGLTMTRASSSPPRRSRIKIIRELIADPTTVITRGTTYDNRANLAPAFLAQIIKRYEGTRLGRQELDAEILEDVPGALWNRALISRPPAAAPARTPRSQPWVPREAP